jgi:uncharacterized phage protein (TIGR02218 family)
MTYDTRERSIQDGQPIELYEFVRGGVTSRFTSADSDKVLSSQTYTSATLQRGEIETSAERARNALRITCARNFPIADLFRVAPPTEIISLIVKRVHDGDTDAAVIWMGRVLNCEWAGASATLNCEPVTSSLRRPGLRRKYSRQCPLVLYSQGLGQCNVNRAAHSTVTTVTGVSGLVLSVAALGSKPWPGGFVEWETEAGPVERRFISEHSGLSLTLSQPFYGLSVGDEVTVSPGCTHTQTMCNDTYSNGANYGGFPFVPRKNPFDGTPVY